MPSQISLELEGRIREVADANMSARSIERFLMDKGIKVSKTTVINVIKNKGKQREARQTGQIFKPKIPFKKLDEDKIKQLDKLTSESNPKTQKEMARDLGVSQPAISKAIKNKLGKITRKKLKVHSLTPKDKINRKPNSRKLLDLLTRDQLEFVVTLDEAKMYLVKDGGHTKHC